MSTTEASSAAREIFLTAVEQHKPHEWEQFLRSACGGDDWLRAKVRQLLDAHAQINSFMDGPAADLGVTTDQSVGPPVGAQIGRYKLLEQIGEGGMGIVYVAEQTEPVKRKVALKIIKPGMDSRQVIARFEAERQALAMMDHPNIAKVLDAGTVGEVSSLPQAERQVGNLPDSGRPYFVMELVRGLPITEYCDQAQLTCKQRLELFISVCQAVQHAHQKGIIHRDLKPGNVLVTQQDSVPVPKVIDFGVAKALHQQLSEHTIYTAFSQIIGTPLYMSPEQAEMTSGDIDTRSDVYSLGVLLYELLTGTTPFDNETLKQAGFDEMRRIIREDEPPRPSQRISTLNAEVISTLSQKRGIDQRRLSHLLRGELDWIVMKALEKDRNRRYESASALGADVERHLTGEPVSAAAPRVSYRLQKFIARNRLLVTSLSAVFVVLCSGIIATAWQWIRASRAEHQTATLLSQVIGQRNRALQAEQSTAKQLGRAIDAEQLASSRLKALQEQTALAKENADIAQAVNNFLQKDLFAQARPANNPRDRKITAEELLKRAAARIPGKFDHQPRVEAAIRASIGNAFLELGDYPAAKPQLERCLELCRQALGEEHVETISALNYLANLYHAEGKYSLAEPLYVRSLELRRRILGETDPATIAVMTNLALVYQKQGQFAKAEPLLIGAIELERRDSKDANLGSIVTMGKLAMLRARQARYTEAEPLYVEALADSRRELGNEHPVTLSMMVSLASLYQVQDQLAQDQLVQDRLVQDQLAKAKALALEGLNGSVRVRGSDHPETLTAMFILASVHRRERELSKAEPLIVQALNGLRRVLGDEHPSTIQALDECGQIHRDQGRLREAETLFGEALAARRRALGEEHPETLISLTNLAHVLATQRRMGEAKPLYEQALALCRKNLGAAHPTTLGTIKSLVRVYQVEGRFAEAEPLIREELAGWCERSGEKSPQALDVLAGLVLNLMQQHKFGEAETLQRKSLAIRQESFPDDWMTFNVQLGLGNLLLIQKKFAEAEPLLVSAYNDLKAREHMIPEGDRIMLTTAVELLVELYTALEKPMEAAKWRMLLPMPAAADVPSSDSPQK